jgi:cephalosporin-C deacetylase-like acetyl esterase
LLQEHYVQRLRATYAQRHGLLKSIRTREQARRYRARVRRAIAGCFGPLPKKTPLKARVTKTTDFGEYLVDHVLYESRPKFLVSAVLYLPKEPAAGTVPGVVFACGHSAEGKALARYASGCIRLARAGYAVLCYDPVNQGERELYTRLKAQDPPLRAGPCQGHNILGKQLAATGDWFGTWRLWDGIRGVDYLLTRPEVDGQRLGVTGNSGGGTLSAYLWAMDRRIAMVASSCWTTSYLLDIENGMPADSEQYPPGFLAQGLDKMDFFLARAGEPAMLLGQERDIFDDRGLKEGYRELRRLHVLLGGSPSLCRMNMDVATHGFTDVNQRAMVSFFNRVLGRRPVRDRPPVPPGESALKVTPRCNVLWAGSRPAYELVAGQARRVARARRRLGPRELPARVRAELSVKPVHGVPHHRRLFQTGTQRPGSTQEVHRFIVEPEPGIQCVLRHVCRGKTRFRLDPETEVYLHLPNLGSQEELARKGVVPRGKRDLWLLDVRGTGESAIAEDDAFKHYGHDYMHAGHALMYGETLLGDRVFDALSAVALLRAEGARRVHLTGRGQGAILALVAGVLDPKIASVSSLGAPESILKMCCTPLNTWPTADFPHGVLRHFDLPDLRRALGVRLVRSTTADPGRFKA